VAETKDELVLSAELPGMNQDDISVEMENGVLTPAPQSPLISR
jgi:HSP20 family molecular chaperone IbpA